MSDVRGFRDLWMDLASSQSLRDLIAKDPDAALAGYVLTSEERSAISSGDPIRPYEWVEAPACLNEQFGLPTGNYDSESQPQRDGHFNSKFSQDAEPSAELIELFRKTVDGPIEDRFNRLLSIMGAVEGDDHWSTNSKYPTPRVTSGVADICILGLGISGIDQISFETDHILRRSRAVFYLGPQGGLPSYLERLCPSVINVGNDAYVEAGKRSEAYRIMAARVIEAALRERPVAFALYGHPLVCADPPFLIRRLAKLADLRVDIRPGISCIDTLFTDLWLDPSNGLLVYDATDVVIANLKFLPDVAAVILQIGALETSLYTRNPSRPKRFVGLVQHLRQFYPLNHVVFAVASAKHPLDAASVLKFELEDMPSRAAEITMDHTLYIPRVSEPAIVDTELFGQLGSQKHLAEITVNVLASE